MKEELKVGTNMNKKKYVIDGRQLLGQLGGVQRVIYEILRELDEIAVHDEIEILVPKKGPLNVEYKNLKIVRYGLFSGLLWEQISFPFYLLKERKKGFFPCTIASLVYPKDMVIICDVMIKREPKIGKAINYISRKLLLFNYWMVAKRTKNILTISEHSKKDIVELYHVDPKRVYVIDCGWQHMQRVESDDSWMSRFPMLKEREFYFSLSANRIQKNYKWILEAAKRHPNDYFAIAGTREEWQKNEEVNAKNIMHLGYIEDGEIKSLMEKCKAFLFPSTYEGFGIPPMEALSVGVKVVVANKTCLPEIYGESVYYIDPYNYDVDLDELLKKKVAPKEEVLNRYSWKHAAEKILQIMHESEDRNDDW